MADATQKVISFTRDDFPSYKKLLRAACAKGIGAIAIGGEDPITTHVDDAFIKDMIQSLPRLDRKNLLAEIPTKKKIKANPRLVLQALKTLFKYRVFVFSLEEKEKFKVSMIRDEYNILKRSCEQWILSESNVYSTCCASLIQANMLDLADEDICENFAGRALFEKIVAAGETFSDKAASELATQLASNKMHGNETVKAYFMRHTGILKTLRNRDLSDTDILDLIEKTVFVRGYLMPNSKQ